MADNVMDAGDSLNGFGFGLGIAAGNQNSGSGIGANGLANGLPGLHGSLLCDGAGVDDAKISLLSAGRPVPLIEKRQLQGFGFKLIDLAPQGFDRKRRHRDRMKLTAFSRMRIPGVTLGAAVTPFRRFVSWIRVQSG